MKAHYARYLLHFKERAETSRGSMLEKETFFLRLTDCDGAVGVGECALFRGLSADDRPDYEQRLQQLCESIESGSPDDRFFDGWPSLRFGYESALADLAIRRNPSQKGPWECGQHPIAINGLIWMGDKATMLRRLREKLDLGFRCIKIKIGGIGFPQELEMLQALRREFGPEEVVIRLDANGSFSVHNALECLQRLSEFTIHSIEQPIRQGQWQEMARICEASPIAVALDEELIGVERRDDKAALLDTVRPAYVILKPALCGGFSGADEWINMARERGIGWWATSALESNVGLRAIGRWVDGYAPKMCQGLGTGQLFTNNIPMPLRLDGPRLYHDMEPQPNAMLNDLRWNALS